MSAIRKVLSGDNRFDFVRLWRMGLVLSAALVLISIVALAVLRLQLGIEFKGGTSWEVPTSSLSVEEARDLVRPLGLAEARIQTVGSDVLRVQGPEFDDAKTTEIREALAKAAGINAEDVALTTVGPSWGSQISAKAIRALVLFFIAVALYITAVLREWRMAVAALVAVVHDIIISVGFYAIARFEVTPATIVAFLTVLGFSLYDTIVVFDKIKENTPKVSLGQRMTYTEMTSLSMNQVLLRSLNTSFVTILPVISILVVGALILGATTLEAFGIALLVGLVAGAYSSIFVATPVLVWLEERRANYTEIRERVQRRASEFGDEVVLDRPGAPTGVTAGAGAAAARTGSAAASATATAVRLSENIPARPRKNKRR